LIFSLAIIFRCFFFSLSAILGFHLLITNIFLSYCLAFHYFQFFDYITPFHYYFAFAFISFRFFSFFSTLIDADIILFLSLIIFSVIFLIFISLLFHFDFHSWSLVYFAHFFSLITPLFSFVRCHFRYFIFTLRFSSLSLFDDAASLVIIAVAFRWYYCLSLRHWVFIFFFSSDYYYFHIRFSFYFIDIFLFVLLYIFHIIFIIFFIIVICHCFISWYIASLFHYGISLLSLGFASFVFVILSFSFSRLSFGMPFSLFS